MRQYRPTLEELREGSPPLVPFHWEIEFPEVFDREQPGFDAIIGNPPFAGQEHRRLPPTGLATRIG